MTIQPIDPSLIYLPTADLLAPWAEHIIDPADSDLTLCGQSATGLVRLEPPPGLAVCTACHAARQKWHADRIAHLSDRGTE